MKVQIPVTSKITDEQLQFIRQLGVAYASVSFTQEDANNEYKYIFTAQ